MTETPPPWSEIAMAIFTFLTAIGAYIGTSPWNTLFAVLLGAAITYFVQRKLQTESEKRRRNVDYVEKYYGPLLVEIQKLRYSLLSETQFDPYVPVELFRSFKTQPQFYTMGKALRTDVLAFADGIGKVPEGIRFYRGKIINLICEAGNPYLMSEADSAHRRYIKFDPDSTRSPIYLAYSRESENFRIPLHDCPLMNKDPLDMVKARATKFQVGSLEVEFNVMYAYDDQSGREINRKAYTVRKKVLDEITAKVSADKREGL